MQIEIDIKYKMWVSHKLTLPDGMTPQEALEEAKKGEAFFERNDVKTRCEPLWESCERITDEPTKNTIELLEA